MKLADMLAEGTDEAPPYRIASHKTCVYWWCLCLNIKMRAQVREQTCCVFLSHNSELMGLLVAGRATLEQLPPAADNNAIVDKVHGSRFR